MFISRMCHLALMAGLVVSAPVARAANLLAIDKSHSQVTFGVKATFTSFVGRFSDYDAEIEVNPADGRVVNAALRFRFYDLKSGNAARDRQMLEWENVAAYPTGNFHLERLDVDNDGVMLAHGRVGFHGAVHDVTFPVAITTDLSIYSLDGEAVLDTRDYGLPVIRKFGFMRVDPLVRVRFHFQGRIAAR